MSASRLFHPRIASTWIVASHSQSNQVQYELSLFASCGKAHVILQGDDFSAKCAMWLTGAEISVDFEGCIVELIPEPLADGAPTYRHEKSDGDLSKPSSPDPTKVGLSVDAGKGEFSADLEHSFRRRSPNDQEFATQSRHRFWDMIGPQSLILDANQTMLNGMLVPGVKGWRIEPIEEANRSVAIARLYAEEEHCRFETISPATISGRLGHSIRSFFISASKAEKRMFNALLQTLASQGLVSTQSTQALLSEYTILFTGGGRTLFEQRSLSSVNPSAKVVIDTEPLVLFVQSNFSRRIALLDSFGIDVVDFLRAEPNPDGPENTEENATSKQTKENSKRRKPSKSYDFLILEGIRAQSKERPIGQSDLYELARAFDVSTNKASLVAKLNRWKHGHQYVQWTRAEDIQITDHGTEEADRLRKFIDAEDMEKVRAAMEAALGIQVKSED